MQFSFLFKRRKFQANRQLVITMLASITIVLSLSHHWLRFWELPVEKQVLLVLFALPALALCIWFLLTCIWERCGKIDRRRWFAFLLPALVLAAGITGYVFSPPVVWHDLEIIPSVNSASIETQLLEIKVPGYNVRFSDLKQLEGWEIREGMLIVNSRTPSPIQYSFLAPVNRPVALTFIASRQSGAVTLILDGEKLDVGLADSQAGQKSVQMNTRYRFGIPGVVMNSIIMAIDWLCFTFLLTLIWLIQEISQTSWTVLSGENRDLPITHRTGLLVLLIFAFILHFVNFLAVPLIVGPDSPGYLDGAVYWIQHHTLDGVSPVRGPGSTFLFIPVMLLFGRNPWGIKILLHLFAIACVPVSYRLGWQLSKRRWFAFSAGLIAVLTPDLIFYSNYVMSDVPNAFLGLLFCTLLLSALETFSWKWLIAAMLVGSFSALFRPENISLLVIGTIFLLAKMLWESKIQQPADAKNQITTRQVLNKLWKLGLSVFLAAVPLLAWSVHNNIQNGFLSATNYQAEALYDGWVYYGESSHIPITDQESSAVRVIRATYQPQPDAEKDSDAPTGAEIYPSLIQHGYTSQQAFSILEQAAKDSIRKNIYLSLKLLDIKIHKGLTPETLLIQTFPLPNEPVGMGSSSSDYFDQETLSIPPAIYLQRSAYDWLEKWYQSLYPGWVWFSLGMMLLCFYRKPFFVWAPAIVIVATRIFVPTIVSMSLWRYVISGIVALQMFAFAGLWSLVDFLAFIFNQRKKPT